MTSSDGSAPVTFDFAFDGAFRACQLPLGITPGRCSVEVSDSTFTARFGAWTVETSLANISCATIAGPYSWWKVVGGPRISFVDNGVTFATTAEKGVCVEFRDPVPNVYPVITRPHPGLTVTVADPDGLLVLLVARMRASGQPGDWVEG